MKRSGIGRGCVFACTVEGVSLWERGIVPLAPERLLCCSLCTASVQASPNVALPANGFVSSLGGLALCGTRTLHLLFGWLPSPPARSRLYIVGSLIRGRPVVGTPLPFVCACAGDPAAVLRSADGLLTARAGPGRRAAASAGAWLGGASACGLRGGVACGGVCHRGHGKYRAFPLPLLWFEYVCVWMMLWCETVCWCVVCVVCACSVCMHVWCVSGRDWGVHGVIVGESVVGP